MMKRSLIISDLKAFALLLGTILCGLMFVPSMASAAASLGSSETTANVAEVKASVTITATSTPTTTNSLVIGLCTISFVSNDGATSDETNCTDNAATIDADTGATNVARTAAQVITAMLGLSNVSTAAHGALATSSTSSTNIIFTTSGTESSATGISPVTDLVAGLGVTFTVTGVVPVAQVVVFTPTGFNTGDVFSLTLNGTTYTYTSSQGTAKDIVEGLDAAAAGSAIGCTENDAALTCTAPTAGTAFTYSTSVEQASGGSSSHRSSSGSSRRKAALKAEDKTPVSAPVSTPAPTGSPAPTSGGYTFTMALSQGSEGSDVTALQNRLTAEGVYTGPITGYFGPLTMAAVVAYQAKMGIEQLGVVGPKTMAALNGSSGIEIPIGIPPVDSGPTTAGSGSFTMNLSEGSSGDEVTALQNRLTAEGVYTGPITGYFGPLTVAAVKAYQEKNGIDPIGSVGPMTRAKLNGSGAVSVPPAGGSSSSNDAAAVPPPPAAAPSY